LLKIFKYSIMQSLGIFETLEGFQIEFPSLRRI
jgi:hypothetical protein